MVLVRTLPQCDASRQRLFRQDPLDQPPHRLDAVLRSDQPRTIERKAKRDEPLPAVQRALVALRSGLLTSDILLALLPARFTLSSLQEAFEAVSGEAADKRNFRKRIIGSGIVRESDEFERGSHRPARLYERAV